MQVRECVDILSGRLLSAVGLTGLSVLLLVGVGCNWIGWGAYVIGGDKKKTHSVKAHYKGLDDKRLAVLVSADEHALYEHPTASLAVCRALTTELAIHVPGADPVDPQQIDQFQQENLYWDSVPYSQLINRLRVDRIVYVDLVEYTTHEAGNRYIWQGTIIANIGVLEGEAKNPNNFAYWNTIQVKFPDDRPVGLLEADGRIIEQQTLKRFAVKVGRLFRDHELTSEE